MEIGDREITSGCARKYSGPPVQVWTSNRIPPREADPFSEQDPKEYGVVYALCSSRADSCSPMGRTRLRTIDDSEGA
ncbi:hypothetical protein PM082_013514 [Marasmius tenuissimus]|nr:hypothetical protein PM082_013514 [Marasmius tenuissimus]